MLKKKQKELRHSKLMLHEILSPPRESFIYNVFTNYATDKPRERLRKL